MAGLYCSGKEAKPVQQGYEGLGRHELGLRACRSEPYTLKS